MPSPSGCIIDFPDVYFEAVVTSGAITSCTHLNTELSSTAFRAPPFGRLATATTELPELGQALIDRLLEANGIHTPANLSCTLSIIGSPFFLITAALLTTTSTVFKKVPGSATVSATAEAASLSLTPSTAFTKQIPTVVNASPSISLPPVVGWLPPPPTAQSIPFQAPGNEGHDGTGNNPGGSPQVPPSEPSMPSRSEDPSPVMTYGHQATALLVGPQTEQAKAPPAVLPGPDSPIAPGATAPGAGSQTGQPIVPLRPQQEGSLTLVPQLQPIHLSPVLTIDGTAVTANPTGAFVIDGQTASPGGAPITVWGHIVSVAPGATAAVVNGVTRPLETATGFVAGTQTLIPGGPVVTDSGGTVLGLPSPVSNVFVNGMTYLLAAPTGLVIGTQTLTPGGRPVTDQYGTVYSLPASSSDIFVNGVPRPRPTSTANLVLGSQTLVPGGPPITVSGTIYSIPTLGTNLVVNGVTVPWLTATEELVLGSQTLIPGGLPITVSGTVLSLAASSVIVVGTQTEVLQSTTPGPNVGDFIFSMFGGGFVAPASTTATTARQLTGVPIALQTADAVQNRVGSVYIAVISCFVLFVMVL